MLELGDMIPAMRGLADEITEICLAHEREAHGGKVCWPNRGSAMAYIGHCLGINDPAALVFVKEMMLEYARLCPDCKHKENPDAH